VSKKNKLAELAYEAKQEFVDQSLASKKKHENKVKKRRRALAKVQKASRKKNRGK
jgi:hypothetical protein